MELTTNAEYQNLISMISETYTRGQIKAHQAVNAQITETYWQIGRHIVEFEQGGKIKADYGKALLIKLAKDLSLRHGKGFSRSNLVYMRLLYLRYPISQMPSDLLSWSHYVELLKLELGKGFTFVGRQYRITVNNTHFRVDLVFYHRILRCFVLIDLKINEVQHQDIGQMNLYMGYFAREENGEGDNPPIGINLTKNKDELLVEYATYQMNSQLFVQKYQLYLPDREELRRELELTLQVAQP